MHPDLSALAIAVAVALPDASAIDSSAEVVSLLIRGQPDSAITDKPLAPLESQETFEYLSRDPILIVAPDDSLQAFSIMPEGLTVGRSSDNDLALDSHKVSRHLANPLP